MDTNIFLFTSFCDNWEGEERRIDMYNLSVRSTYFFYWGACTELGKCAVLYMTDFASFYNFYLEFLNFSDSEVFYFKSFIIQMDPW